MDARRVATWAGTIALVGVLALYAAAGVVVDRALVEERLSRALPGNLEEASVHVGSVRPLPLRLGVSVRSLRIDVGATPTDPRSRPPRRRGWTLVVPRVDITGIGLSTLAGGETIRLGRVRITDATLDLSALFPASFPAGVANGVDLDLRDLSLEAGGVREVGTLLPFLSRISVPSYRARSPDGRTHFRLQGLEADLRTGGARLEEMGLVHTEPAVPPRLLPRPGRTLRDTTSVTLAGLVADGLFVGTEGGGGSLGARSLAIDSFRVHVVDGVVPDTSTDRGLPVTPVQRLREFGGPSGRVDSVRFDHGRVRFTVRRVGYRGSGAVLFDRIEGTIRPLPYGSPSAPAGDSSGRAEEARGPVRVAVRGRLAGSASAWLEMTFPDRREGLRFDASGAVAALDLTELNSIFRPTEGIHIRSGRLASLRFRLRVRDGRAEGRLVPVYDDLGISLEDPRRGGTGLDEHFETFVLGLRLNARNQPGDADDFRVGSIDVAASPGQTFPSFLWQALLGGLRDAAGV